MLAKPFADELRTWVREGGRYLAAAACALAVDFGTYVALIQFAGVHYLVAAPVAFALGLVVIYVLSARWAFSVRRYSDRRIEFLLFGAIGCAGLLLNQAVIYAGVSGAGLSPEVAKLVSAAIVFGFNFSARKLLLFTSYRSDA